MVRMDETRYEEKVFSEVEGPVLAAGLSLEQAQAAVIMLHGRGASAHDILINVPEIDLPGWTYLAPQAPDHTWYPNSFTVPLQENEPYLSSSLRAISGLLARLDRTNIPPERTVLFGFSQGACLALEYAVRHPRRYGALVGLSGGLIGPDDTARDEGGSLQGTPVFMGCSDVDPYIPEYRLQYTADTLRAMGASVALRLYPDMAHTINQDELSQAHSLMSSLATS
jgi:predicted esterase